MNFNYGFENEYLINESNIDNVDMKKLMENNMVNSVEWIFLNKIVEDNSIYLDSKISIDYFTDPLARVLYGVMGKIVTQLGEFKPLIHLKDFCNDEYRMIKYRDIGYPLEKLSPDIICKYMELFNDKDIKHTTVEFEIQKEYQKRKLVEYATEILETVDDTNSSVKELTSKISFALDNLLYQNEDTIEAKSTNDVTQDMLHYLESDLVDEYVPTCIDAIDMQAGGTTVPAVICWAANAKVGKSSLLIETIVENLKRGRTVSVYSIEMNIKEVMLRMYAKYAGVDFTKIGKKEYSKEEKEYLREKVIEFEERFKDKFFIYFDPTGLSCKSIEVHIGRLAKAGIEVQDIFVDYLQLLDSFAKPNGTKVEKMIEVPKEVRMLAQKLNIRVDK